MAFHRPRTRARPLQLTTLSLFAGSTAVSFFFLCSCKSERRRVVMATSERKQPLWQPPTNEGGSRFFLYNSLTRKKEPFVPLVGRQVKWYMCGPTVYDVSHMGHARSYMSFDIVRRVLSDYFGFDITYVMNITDIDDKIIVRARRNFLFEEYTSVYRPAADLLSNVSTALERHRKVRDGTKDEAKRTMLDRQLNRAEEARQALETAAAGGRDTSALTKQLLEEARDPLCAWLDAERDPSRSFEHSIFSRLTQRMEALFHQDMESLNILPASCLTRVSEYVPEVVAYIQQIMANGFAYEAEGSVYFDVEKFANDPKHHYAKLVPEAVGDMAALAEGEGELTAGTGKRSDKDFALWKASKSGEPSWPSPWGEGRPGWHIECSVMACDILGEKLDIHSGGIDLRFPHHDNEIAQAEACHGHSSWVQYFLHAGHLTIEGCKMSKSLKNFITIREALEKHGSRLLRLAFLTHTWNADLDYSENVMAGAKQLDKFFNEFFLHVKDAMRLQASSAGSGELASVKANQRWGTAEKELHTQFVEKKALVHEALQDSINTVAAMRSLRELAAIVNTYMQQQKLLVNGRLLHDIAAYITQLFRVFGLINTSDALGWSGGDSQALSREEAALPFVSELANFRDLVRTQAREHKLTDLLAACDRLRNETLPNLGVSLEDRADMPAVVKFVDREALLEERRKEKAAQEEKQRLKAEAKRKAQEQQALKEAKRRIPPNELFRSDEKFTQFDEQGIPTHERAPDGSEKPVSGKQRKRLVKLYEQQKELYEGSV